MEWYEGRGPDRLGHTERDFKVCDLCGALNPATNAECFVCNWSGMFHTDRERIYDAMRTMEDRFGEFDDSIFDDGVVPSTPPKPGLWTEIWGSLKKLFSRA